MLMMVIVFLLSCFVFDLVLVLNLIVNLFPDNDELSLLLFGCIFLVCFMMLLVTDLILFLSDLHVLCIFFIFLLIFVVSLSILSFLSWIELLLFFVDVDVFADRCSIEILSLTFQYCLMKFDHCFETRNAVPCA